MTLKKTLCTVAAFVLMMTMDGACLGQTLREYADRAGVLVGAAVEPRLLNEPEYAATLAREFNMLTAENALKWGAIRSNQSTFNFAPGDRLVAFAQKHRMKVRGHCLAWSEYNPGWLVKGNFTPAQMSELLREHITKVMQHYRGKVFAWDVVNEVFLADGSVEPSVWYDQPGIGLKGKGTAYVEQALRWARAADPDALLFYNDYDTEGVNPKSDAVYEMVKDFRARGVPIDGVGIQAHIVDLEARDLATIEQNIARLSALGLQVHVTEMDVGLPAGAGQPDAATLKRQAEIYRRIADACLRQPRCTAFQTWGFTDKYTWIPNFTKGAKGAPLPFDASYKKKPAYDALLEAFRERAPGRTALAPPVELTAEQDHQRMLKLLGIERLRPGVDGYNRSAPNAVNYDESKANSHPSLPDPLLLKNGRRVTTARAWWDKRRPEIVEEFDREVYGRAPKVTPGVKWEVLSTSRETNGGVPVVVKKLVGHVDNSSYAPVKVDIDLTLTTPADAVGPVPVMLELSWVFPPGWRPPPVFTPPPGPTWQQQVLPKGWGYASYVPVSVQPDNGAGLTKGIIGLVNKGQPRKPDDWGALRAWAWGASRALDYFETDRAVDAKQVGITGHSRYGKAAAVAMAYDPRFAIAYISSSGAGGLNLYRRNLGELLENVAASGEYHWMAGNFVRYAGPLTAADLPVDSHELIALCAPRPVFVGAGAMQQGDGWVDAKGMFLATAAAAPVYTLLGKKGMGTAEFPPIETALIDGDVAYRQHAGGHTPGPNWPTFITFASRYLKAPAARLTPKRST
ncbi:MAG: (4-O-methyl)-D-glucuronate---lignin esterase [Acidobacteriota bacterium]|jgi:GH35 family endo-1,4-beta-xylanase|nr:(4-O-methyl)-D-glucuronate---lignin esterase [Acidobacteriota bacterium]